VIRYGPCLQQWINGGFGCGKHDLPFCFTFAQRLKDQWLNYERDFGDPLKDDSIRQLIESFERNLADGSIAFLEEPEFEDIIDYYLDRDDLHGAMQAVEHAIIQHRFSSTFLLRKASILTDMKKYPRALDVLDEVELIDPGEPETYFLKADIFTELGKHARAIEVLCKAESLCDADDIDDIYLTMAEVYEAWEKFDKAFFFLSKSLKANPKNDDALYRMWFVVNLTEKYEESVTLHHGIIDQHPYSFFAWYNLGQAYFGLGLFEKASEAFEYVTLINEGYEMAFRDWAEALFRSGNPLKAIGVLEHSISMFEPDELAYFKLGLYNERTGNADKARKYYREAVKLDPYFAEAYVRTAVIFREEDQLAEAQRAIRKAIRINPDNPAYHLLMADVSREVGDVESVIAALRSCARLQPNSPDNWLQLSRQLFDCGMKQEAIEAIDRGIEHCGEGAGLLFTRSALLFSTGLRDEALLELHSALAADTAALSIFFDMMPGLLHDDQVNLIIHRHHRK